MRALLSIVALFSLLKDMKRRTVRIIGVIMITCGALILSVFTYKRISREIYLRKLLDENVIFEIPSLNIRVPVLEGTDSKSLQVSAGHFEGTGSPGRDNYCIAGHNSTIYAEIFNDLDNIQIGAEMHLIDNDEKRTDYIYIVTEYAIVDPHNVDVLNDYGDDRLTVISCTDDGEYRQVVVGILKENK